MGSFGEHLVHFWRMFDQFLENIRLVFGELSGSFWRTIAQFQENFWAFLENFFAVFLELIVGF